MSRPTLYCLLCLTFFFVACEDGVSSSGVDGSAVTDSGRRLNLDVSMAADGSIQDVLALIDTQSPVDSQPLDSEPIDQGVSCAPNEIVGCANINAQRVCDGSGMAYVEVPCGAEERCQAGECVPSVCGPGLFACIDDRTIGACRRDGSGFIPARTCDADSPCVDGRCESTCNPEGKIASNIGCEYWSVDLDNYPDPFSNDPSSVPHAVVISNTSSDPAMVTIEGPAGVPLVDPEFVVDAGDLHVFTFPRLDIDGTGIFDRAFKINATQPVIAYQFNPLNNEGVASNDASLLLPKEGLGRDYIGLSWPSGTVPCIDMDPANCLPDQNGYLTIVATARGNTTVRVTPTATIAAGGMIPELAREMEHEFVLAEGEVLSLQALANDLSDAFPPCMTNEDCETPVCIAFVCVLDIDPGPSTDLTGSIISANQPIAVFGGHEEAVVGEGGNCCAEHLEQQLLPVSSWGTHYLAARSEPRGGSNEYWRVVAQADGTEVQTTLANPEHQRFTLNRGEFREIVTDGSFEVTASHPVMVAQYLVSQGETQGNVGDPALIVVPPTNQLRDSYQIITPSGYSSNWLTVAREAGSQVTLDGVVLDANRFTAFGSNQYEYAWLEVDEGVHHLEGDAAFALTVYGYSAAVSYGYPGGLNLRSDEMP
jgi:hypothetical protein